MDNVFKVVFINDDKLYEIYAKDLIQSALFGFIEVEEIIFDEHSGVVVDPSEEKLKAEFSNVVRSYIPMHNIIRIDEVPKQGVAKIHNSNNNNNIKQFPGSMNNTMFKPREPKD